MNGVYICLYTSKVVVNHYFVQQRLIVNVQCSSIVHREALNAQLQMDRFRFVNYHKFVTKHVILHIEVQSSKIILIEVQSSFRWYLPVLLLQHVDFQVSSCLVDKYPVPGTLLLYMLCYYAMVYENSYW